MNTEQELREQLSGEIRGIASEAEKLIEVKGQELAERTQDIRDRLQGALQTAQETLQLLQTQTQESIKTADKAIRSHPYQAIGIAVGVGLVLGMLMKKK